MKTGQIIYWRWLDSKALSKSYIQGIIKTESGDILELSDSVHYTAYPNRILKSEVFILTQLENKE